MLPRTISAGLIGVHSNSSRAPDCLSSASRRGAWIATHKHRTYCASVGHRTNQSSSGHDSGDWRCRSAQKMPLPRTMTQSICSCSRSRPSNQLTGFRASMDERQASRVPAPPLLQRSRRSRQRTARLDSGRSRQELTVRRQATNRHVQPSACMPTMFSQYSHIHAVTRPPKQYCIV